MASTINAKNTSTGVVITPDASGQLELQTADTTRMTITSSGKVGIGNTSPATTGTAGMTIGVNTILSDVVNGQSLFGNNVYYDGSWKYYTTGVYTAVRQQNGAVTFHSGPSASAGSTASNMDTTDVKMIINSSGNVGIGTSSPASALDVQAASGVSMFRLTATTGTSAVYSRYSNTGGFLYLGRDNSSGTDFGSAYSAGIWSTGAYPMLFGTNGIERMRITDVGEVWIAGTTDRGAFNLQCNGTGVWGAGAYTNGSDARIKDDITPLDSGLDVVEKLNPVTYKYKEDWSKDQSIQTGFIAQDLLVALEGKEYVDGIVNQSSEYMSVAYQNIIPILTKAIQELKAELDTVKAELATLKGTA